MVQTRLSLSEFFSIFQRSMAFNVMLRASALINTILITHLAFYQLLAVRAGRRENVVFCEFRLVYWTKTI